MGLLMKSGSLLGNASTNDGVVDSLFLVLNHGESITHWSNLGEPQDQT